MHHVTVGVRLTVHVVALHDALEATALDGADDVDHLADGELLDGEDVADLDFRSGREADFLEVADRRDAGLLEVAEFGAGETALLLFAEADLHGVVTVAEDGLDLRHGTRAGLDDRNRDEVVLPVVYLGHSDFLTE